MSNRAWMATRKGLFELRREGAGWAVKNRSFAGDPVTSVLEDARSGYVYAGVKSGHYGPKLFRSADGGQEWTECGTPAYPAVEDGTGAKLDTLWCLESGTAAQPGRLWAGTLPGGLFRSDDDGLTWELVTSLWERPERQSWFGGGFDKPGIHSIVVDARDGRHVTLGVSCGGVWHTRDDGATWTLAAKGMKASYMPPELMGDENSQDPHRIVACAGAPDTLWSQHHCGIFRSVDGGLTWSEHGNSPVGTFGFAVAADPGDARTAWFVPARSDEQRYAVDGAMTVLRTEDGGESFEVLRQGLPGENCYDVVYRHALDVEGAGEQLLFGSTTGNVFYTGNRGAAWSTLGHCFPPVYAVRFA